MFVDIDENGTTILMYTSGTTAQPKGVVRTYLTLAVYVMKTTFYLDMADVWSGLIKGLVFGVLISMICCYYGLITEGGPMGLGRNTMVAVVTSLVVIVLADALLTAAMVSYLY